MSVKDVFSVRLVTQEEQGYPYLIPLITEDITSGILSVDIVQGNDFYEGPWQQIDTGQFTIVTRNPNMDPKLNENIKYNSRIEFLDSRLPGDGVFWTGWVTDINVEYQRNDDPIITINGTDILGIFQRSIVTQEMYDAIVDYCTNEAPQLLDTGIDFEFFMFYVEQYITRKEPFSLLVKYPFYYQFVGGTPGLGNATPGSEGVLAYRPAAYFPKVGETILEVINKYAQTNLDYFTLSPGQLLIYPLAKYNGAFWKPQTDPAIEYAGIYNFSSDPADNKPYESILINNGYNSTTNQIEVSNESRFFQAGELKSETNNFGDYTIEESAQDWAVTKASLSTILDLDHANDTELQRYATDIFQIIAFPSDEIQKITFNNARYEDIQNDVTRSGITINQFVHIKHQVNNAQTIDRFYDIAGITHSISPDEWTMGYTLKPSQQEIVFEYQGQVPTIQMNAITGDTNFNFTATITDYPIEDIDYVLWDLNQIDANEEIFFYPSAFSGEKFKNGLKRTGLTQTWNFDDDGILEPYSANNPFGRIGAGNYWVTAYLFLKNGFSIVVQQPITVGTPEVTADFLWTQNLTNNFGQVTFTNTSYNHETGEPDSYAWDFGDGTTSNLESPIKIYDPAPGQTTYNVSLTVFTYGEEGEKVYNTKTTTVTLVQPAMTADFTSSANGSVVTFTNTSTNVGFEEPDAYLWDFGDGTTSTQKNPTKTFSGQAAASTTYSVTLTTRNIWEQTATVTKNITIAPLYNTGTLQIGQVRLQTSPFFDDGFTLMSYLKCLRSDGANLSLNANTSVAPSFPGQTFIQNNGATAILPGTQLTRNPATSAGIYGLKPSSLPSNVMALDTGIAITQNINSISMLFDDNPVNTYLSTSWDRVYAVVPDSFGGRYPIGYWDLPPTPNFAPRQIYGREYVMTPIRPMPPNIPYFKYTFNNRTVSFTSMETGVSYAWTFGDGTTSTLKDPVKTYAAKGTYNVTLVVTFAGGTTRTTTEPVIVEALAGHPVRYIKFGQKEHIGLNAWDTPYINSLTARFNRNSLVQTAPVAKFYINPVSIAKSEGYSMQWYPGTVSPDQPGPTSPMDPLLSPNNDRLYTTGGLRIKSLDGTFRTKWELTGDFGTAINNIQDFRASFSRWSNRDGTPNPVCTGISYEVFITDYVGAPAGIGTATWTKIGEFNPTNMPLNTEKLYTMTSL